MPFSQPLCYPPIHLWPAQVCGRAHAALYVLVQEPIVEPGEERGREPVPREQAVRRCFLWGVSVRVGGHVGEMGGLTLAVYQHVSVLSICTQQDGFVINLRLGEPRQLVDGFEELQQVHVSTRPLSGFLLSPPDPAAHTVLVMPSVKRTNSIESFVSRHSGRSVSTRFRAEFCESALLYVRLMYRIDSNGSKGEFSALMVLCSALSQISIWPLVSGLESGCRHQACGHPGSCMWVSLYRTSARRRTHLPSWARRANLLFCCEIECL